MFEIKITPTKKWNQIRTFKCIKKYKGVVDERKQYWQDQNKQVEIMNKTILIKNKNCLFIIIPGKVYTNKNFYTIFCKNNNKLNSFS